MSIIGFGDFEIGQQCVPSLTTVSIDARLIGARVAEVILDVLRSGNSDERPAIVNDVGFEIVTRESTRINARNPQI